jgi:hypothetical protein
VTLRAIATHTFVLICSNASSAVYYLYFRNKVTAITVTNRDSGVTCAPCSISQTRIRCNPCA